MPYNIRLVSDIRISIIIPCFNEERYLARCLDSVAAQIVTPHEVLVVDNNSTDKTTRVAGHYPFVKVLHESQQGRAYAQHTGFDAASGNVVARIDADAILLPDWTQRVAEYFARPGARATAWTGGAHFYNVRLPRLVSVLYDWVAFRGNRLLTGHPSLWGSSMALPRALWQEVAHQVCLRSDIHEDLDLSIHLHLHGHQIVYDSRTQVNVELRPAYARPAKVWAYLHMWPLTLRLHHIRTWPLCWPLNVVIFAGMPFFGLSERIARLSGRRPLSF